MWKNLMHMGLAVFFAACGAWLFCYGVELIDGTNKLAISNWAWSIQVTNIFAFLAPVVSIGWWIGSTFNTAVGEVPWHIAGAFLYFGAALALLVGRGTARMLVALACWLNAASLLFRMAEFIFYGGLSIQKMLLAIGINSLFLLAFIYLGFCAKAGLFVRSSGAAQRIGSRL